MNLPSILANKVVVTGVACVVAFAAAMVVTDTVEGDAERALPVVEEPVPIAAPLSFL